MDEEILSVALRNALVEIKNAVPSVNWSFILTNDGTVISSEKGRVDPNMAQAASSFQALAEKAGAVGGLDNVLITGENGRVFVSSINDLYLVAGLDNGADLAYFRAISGAVVPTVLKVLDAVASSVSLVPTPFKPTPPIPYPEEPEPSKPVPSVPDLKFEEEKEAVEEEPIGVQKSEESEEPQEPSEPVESQVEEPEEVEEAPDEVQESAEEQEEQEEQKEPQIVQPPEPVELTSPESAEERVRPESVPSQQLIVDRFSGLMVKADTVQLDADVLKRWSEALSVKMVQEVDVETFSGKSARCKAKVITDSKLEGRGLVRIPEKTCQSLDVRRGELVRVKPVVAE